MRIRKTPFYLIIFLLLSALTMPAIACPSPDCGACCHWVSTGPGPSDGYCELNEDADCGDCADCNPCYSCVSCTCEWDCTTGQCCDDGDCVDDCPTGECCDDGTCVSSCPSGECCSGGTCVSSCPSGECCDDGTCVSTCPSGQCCSNGMCVSTCPSGECCDSGTCVSTCPGCKSCSGGSCEDDNSKCNDCQNCSDGECVVKPTLGCGKDEDCGQCKECNLDTCFCDDICIECQECVEDNCISCGALGKVCCDEGFCEEPCEEEDDETSCSSANDEACITCIGWIGDCSDYTTDLYTNETIYSCSGGCFGDCEDVQGPVCYRTYKCKLFIRYRFAECSDMSETGPVPLDCYHQEVTPWQCDRCGTDYNELEDEYYAEDQRCYEPEFPL